MSKETLEYHWGKHHRSYVDNLKKQIEGTELASSSLEDIVKATYNGGQPTAPFNNAAQAWNHEFFWLSMAPGGGGEVKDDQLKSLLDRDFGSFNNFVSEFKQAGATQFGSGWAWLSVADGKLVVEKSPNAINPLVLGHIVSPKLAHPKSHLQCICTIMFVMRTVLAPELMELCHV